MRTVYGFALLTALLTATFPIFAAAPRALPGGQLPHDARLQPLKDLNGYFPFAPPASKAEWARRAEIVRRQVRVALGVWPMPTKTPLEAVVHGKIDKPEYTIEKVYFQSAPGLFVTGNLYRPKGREGKVPAVLFAHGHWKDARLSEEAEVKLRTEIATGEERFEEGGRSRFQSLCVQLARMGCVVWQWDMLSDSDALQLSAQVVHRFAKQRPEMNTTADWGLYSPQAEAHLQSIMGLQTLNSIRSLDFVLSLPEVDPERVAMTGASGGGTQTMILAALDPRLALSFPVVMVSTAMQGGCTCENTSLLRIDTGNVEFAALFAPKPQGMTTANDWTKEMSTKGFPELQQLYGLFNARHKVLLQRGEHFPHNYNAVTRSAFYTWVNKQFKLGCSEPVIERDYTPLKRAELTVWDEQHPAPQADDADFERRLLRWLHEDAQRQLDAASGSLESFRALAGAGVEAILGRTLAMVGEITWQQKNKTGSANYVELTGLLRNDARDEELPVVWLCPPKPDGRVVVWLDEAGKAALFTPDGAIAPAVQKLLAAGVTILGADLLFQGELVPPPPPAAPPRQASPKSVVQVVVDKKKDLKSKSRKGKEPVEEVKQLPPGAQNRVVANPREFAGYTYGYNHCMFAQRTHDVLTLVAYLRNKGLPQGGQVRQVAVVGFGVIGPIAAAARAVSGGAIDRLAVDTGGFRFGNLLDYRDVSFLPGGAKYGDLPGLLALGAPGKLWLAGEGSAAPVLAKKIYDFSGAAITVSAQRDHSAAVRWLLTQP